MDHYTYAAVVAAAAAVVAAAAAVCVATNTVATVAPAPTATTAPTPAATAIFDLRVSGWVLSFVFSFGILAVALIKDSNQNTFKLTYNAYGRSKWYIFGIA